jgi:hypothetical protein
MLIDIDIEDAPPIQTEFDKRINGPDCGLISAWQAGILMAASHTSAATVEAARRGELPMLPFKGGVERKTKTLSKIGALQYLAMWHGLRGEGLQMDTDACPTKTCSRTGITVSFTRDVATLLATE